MQDVDIIDSSYKKNRLKEIENSKILLSIYQTLGDKEFANYLKSNLTNYSDIALIKLDDDIYSNLDVDKIKNNERYFFYDNLIGEKNFQIVFQRKDLYSEMALSSMLYFTLLIFLVFFITIFYKNYFYKNIVKPTLTMKRGFEDINFLENVEIPLQYSLDEIYLLANNYNLRWLEAKKRKLNDLKVNGLSSKN